MTSRRGIGETVLLAAWVYSYAALVFAFRVLHRFESKKPSKESAQGPA
jgi:hypothetical protein